MPPQLKTLIPLFAVFIFLFLVARYFLVPESFGVQGHFRFNSIEENRDKPMYYAGKDACAECHDDKALEMESDMHATISCETCHGPGLAHYDNPDSTRLIIPDERAFCGHCHAYNPTRKGMITQVDLNDHNVDKKCIECHNPHLPWELTEENNPEENL
jgi:DnaJ-class molecular chaperone